MGKIRRYLILLLLAAGIHVTRAQEPALTFREVDRQSLDLYNKGEWKELVRFSNRAFREGFDYYYLRLRAGIACFETRQYMKAVLHFKEALAFFNGDPVAGEYLYSCYLELNRSQDAVKAFNELPASARERLVKTLPKMHQADLETGPILCNQAEKIDSLDLDGADNIYGEADITLNGYYVNAGLSWEFKNGFDAYTGYSLIGLNKNKLVQINDTISVDEKYPLAQHQFYLSGNIPVGKAYIIRPAINLVLDRYENIMPVLDNDSITYLFPLEKTKLDSYIGYLSVTKDFKIVRTSIFAAYSNLNKQEQFQAGFCVVAFPFGNLDLYFSSKLMNHRNDGQNHVVFEQMAGVRLFKPVWTEISATFGQMNNYHESNAFVVYNIADKMKFKGTARLIYTINIKWTVTAEYLYLLREGEYLSYADPLEDGQVIPITLEQEFNNQVILIGLKWNF